MKLSSGPVFQLEISQNVIFARMVEKPLTQVLKIHLKELEHPKMNRPNVLL